MLELWLGFLACVTFASFLAIGAPKDSRISLPLFAPLAVVPPDQPASASMLNRPGFAGGCLV
jgi:hypothetical protein